jgi:hypothetical protein
MLSWLPLRGFTGAYAIKTTPPNKRNENGVLAEQVRISKALQFRFYFVACPSS